MPVVPTTAYSQAEDALTLSRALLNDSAASVFTDTLLMPFLNSAHRDLRHERGIHPRAMVEGRASARSRFT